MNQQEFQALEDLQVDNFNRWARYDNWGRRPVYSTGVHRDGPIGRIVGIVFWVVIAIWLLSAMATIL